MVHALQLKGPQSVEAIRKQIFQEPPRQGLQPDYPKTIMMASLKRGVPLKTCPRPFDKRGASPACEPCHLKGRIVVVVVVLLMPLLVIKSIAVASAASFEASLELRSTTLKSRIATPDAVIALVFFTISIGTSIGSKHTHNGHRNFLAPMAGAPGSMITSNAPRLARGPRIQRRILKLAEDLPLPL